jgi:hypothetical protein
MAAIPESALASAERNAAAILSRAGVRAAWIDCDHDPDLCRRSDLGPAEFRLFVLAPGRPGVLHPETEGFSVIFPSSEAENYAAVFYPIPGELPHRVPSHVQYLLGAVMAHEIGHLLLGAQSHAPGGVMTVHFTSDDIRSAGRGELRFTTDQAARMRAEIRRRLN